MPTKRRLLLDIALLAFAAIIKILSFFPAWVERFYSNGFYNLISKFQRALLGWLPFSVGDIIYSLAAIILIIGFFRFFKTLWNTSFKKPYLWQSFKNIFRFVLFIYVYFNISWGLNYDRSGIAYQLQLKKDEISRTDLDTIVSIMQRKLNKDAESVDTNSRVALKNGTQLFDLAIRSYGISNKKFPFLSYKPVSLKPSMFGVLLNFMSTEGYYNPFTGEAQVNKTVPVFILPFITNHEIAHQLAYGKESEANFAGYLVGKTSKDANTRYATHFAMYRYAARELWRIDSSKVKQYDSLSHPLVKSDLKNYREFYKKYDSMIEPLISWMYGNYLKANKQPSGNRSYDEVVVWLIAYYKKFGAADL